jgi:transposase-like protein
MAKRGRKPKYLDQACPNKACSFYGQRGKGNVVSNGTYLTQSGRVRQFVCRSCKTNFTDHTGTFFYDLRTPKEKVLLAIKLLAKGMPLRGVAEVLEVKLDTVRPWLNVAAKHCEKVNELLIKELKVSQVELDALWTFVKKNSLRQRAILWRKGRSGSGFPLPENIG